jgi:hypothetical protein
VQYISGFRLLKETGPTSGSHGSSYIRRTKLRKGFLNAPKLAESVDPVGVERLDHLILLGLQSVSVV